MAVRATVAAIWIAPQVAPEAPRHVAVRTVVDGFHTGSSNDTKNRSEWTPDWPVERVELEVGCEEGSHQEYGSQVGGCPADGGQYSDNIRVIVTAYKGFDCV